MHRSGLALLLSFFYLDLCGQAPESILFEHVPVPGTIKSALTEAIAQDEYGMMWIAKDALYRYDGREFTRYDVVANDSTPFSSREITTLFWDSVEHRLLIGTRNFGIVVYRYETNRLEGLPTRDGRPIVSDIARTPSGILITSMTSGFFHLRGDTLVKSLPGREADESSPGVRWPSRMLVRGDRVWVACQNEVVVLEGGTVVKRFDFDTLKLFSSASVRSSAILFDHRGHLWIGTERDGISVLDTASMKIVRRFPLNQAPFYNAIVRIVQDQHNLVWIATKGDGLIVYDPENNNIRQILSNDRAPGSISGDHCTSVTMDQSGIVWVGTAGDVNKYDRDQIKFKHYNHNPNDPNSLSDDNIRNIFTDDAGIVYACTSGGFINIFDRANNKVERLKPRVKSVNSFIAPLCVVQYDQQNLLVGTNAGLLQFNKPTRTFRYFAPLEKYTRGGYVRQVLFENNRICLLLRGAVVTYLPETGNVNYYSKDQNVLGASSLAIDYRNRLWVGVNKGVAYLDDEDDKFHVVPLLHDEVRPDSSFFLALSLQQIGHELWINSFNDGIYMVDLRMEPPAPTGRITTKSGLIDNTVYASLPDMTGNVWITHNSGLTRYDPRKQKFIHFSVSEGLQGEEFNRLAFFKTNDGEILIGGTNGINAFTPEQISIRSTPAEVTLVDLTAYALRRHDMEPMYVALVSSPREVRISHDYNTFRLSFFIPDYHEPSRINLQYKLEPFDKGWVATDKLYTNTYANLLPGSYNFSVRAISLTGEETVSTLVVSVTPPYWKTWWFLGLTAVVVSFLVYSVINSRVQATRRETKRLEDLLKSRTREIEQSREELENLNKKKDLIFSILSHDLRSPLTTLKGFLGLLIDNSDALTKDELQKYATNIRNSVTTSLDLIDNTLFWSLSQTGNIQCNPTHVPVGPLLAKIRDLYQLTADKKQINITFLSVNGLSVHADENMVYVLLRNLVSNAIKFTPEMNSITIDAVQQGALVSIRISDHGIGMSQQEIDNIFTLDNPMVKKGTSSEKGTGLGLLLCKKFVELNKGKLLIESKPGEGSSFTVILPSS